MTKSLLLIVFLSILKLNAQEKKTLPNSFKLDSTLLSGMYLSEISDDFKSKGLTRNPGVTDNKDIIKYMTGFESDDISQMYYEVYRDKEDQGDAGVIVSLFISEDALTSNLGKLKDQSNLAYLIKGNYFILVWCDKSKNSEAHINEMVSYYKNKIGAEFYQLEEHGSSSSSVEVTAVE